MPPRPSASFDVLGTCFHFEPAIAVLHDILTRQSSPPTSIDATTLFHSWFYAAQRDFTYTSVAGSYMPIIQIFKHTLRRAFTIVGFPDPAANISDEDVERVMKSMSELPAREGFQECWAGLREAGWDVFAVTNGGRAGTKRYFQLAGVELSDDFLVSCDDDMLRCAKPDVRVYERANEVLAAVHGTREDQGEGQGEKWFVAAHSWDLLAARKAGFRTAWVAHEEGDPCTSIFGRFDIHAKTLKECAEKMIAATRT